jgi:hypothetical protein
MEFVAGVCIDGPLAGHEVRAINEVGWSVTISTLSSNRAAEKTPCVYEVVSLASPDEPAVLRFVRATTALSAYPEAPLRSATDLGTTLDETP